MDVEQVEKDLKALRQLYRLLLDPSQQILNERAKSLLKNMLDDATTKAFVTQSKMLGSNHFGMLAKSPVSNVSLNSSMASNVRTWPTATPAQVQHNLKNHRELKKQKEGKNSDFSIDISASIQRIESHLSAIMQPCSSITRGQYGSAAAESGVSKKPIQSPSLKPILGQQLKPIFQSPDFVHGLRVPSCQDDSSIAPVIGHNMAHLPMKSNPAENKKKQKNEVARKGERPNNNLRPILVDPPYRRTHLGPRNKIVLPSQQRFEKASSSRSESSSSSSWTTEHSGAGSSSCKSEGPTSSRFVDEGCKISFSDKSSLRSISTTHNREHGNVDPTKTQKSCKKPIGRLRRFKNKLGFIFHHHHHHHYHHHRDDTVWKQVGKLFGTKKAKENFYSDENNKQKKSLVKSMPHKQPVGHFNALARRMLRHVWKSKKSRPSVDGKIRGMGQGPRGHKKKVHWWQMLRRHRGIKLSNKGRVKLGSLNKKARLK